MGVSISTMSLRNFALSMGFTGSSLFLTTPSKMGLLRGGIGPLLEQLELCCMIRIYHCSYG